MTCPAAQGDCLERSIWATCITRQGHQQATVKLQAVGNLRAHD